MYSATTQKDFRSKAVALISAKRKSLCHLFLKFISPPTQHLRSNCYSSIRHHSSVVHCNGETAVQFDASAQEVAAA
jgi:hypothetical protein